MVLFFFYKGRMTKKIVIIRRKDCGKSSDAIRYGECMKNHAANTGGHAVDGCREFSAAAGGEEWTSAVALTCAACGCHRNFHRREEVGQ